MCQSCLLVLVWLTTSISVETLICDKSHSDEWCQTAATRKASGLILKEQKEKDKQTGTSANFEKLCK